MELPAPIGKVSSVFSPSVTPSQSGPSGGIRWSTEDFVKAHLAVASSGKYNFEGCRIPIPTPIRYDRLRIALGATVSPKELRTLDLLEFGMPIGCNSMYGVKKHQKNHYSASSFKVSIKEYLFKNVNMQAILGPFDHSPIPDLCFSPLMTVPKEETKRRVIVDFSFPPGSAINDRIPKSTYLENSVEFSLPSIQSMVSRLNKLGSGCLLYKRSQRSL